MSQDEVEKGKRKVLELLRKLGGGKASGQFGAPSPEEGYPLVIKLAGKSETVVLDATVLEDFAHNGQRRAHVEMVLKLALDKLIGPPKG